MITFRPIGRLGNNMFQTAACIGYAKEHGTEWAIPQRRGAGDNDPWLLPTFWPNLPQCYGSMGPRYEQHDPSMFNYKAIPYLGSKDMTLVGFFQSERWFENAKEEVKKAFPLKHYPEYDGYVSIHVRRGDYVTHSNSFPPVDEKYIYSAFNKIPYGFKPFFFSDDIEWCKNHFGSREDVKFDDLPTGHGYELEKLSLMASCSHHIIANSSFSWWGAWLGHNPTKIVVSPHAESWFGTGFTGGVPVDLIPKEWIQIKFR